MQIKCGSIKHSAQCLARPVNISLYCGGCLNVKQEYSSLTWGNFCSNLYSLGDRRSLGVRPEVRLLHGWGYNQSWSSSQPVGTVTLPWREEGEMWDLEEGRENGNTSKPSKNLFPYAISELQRTSTFYFDKFLGSLWVMSEHFPCGNIFSSSIWYCLGWHGVRVSCRPCRHEGVDRWACAVQGGSELATGQGPSSLPPAPAGLSEYHLCDPGQHVQRLTSCIEKKWLKALLSCQECT